MDHVAVSFLKCFVSDIKNECLTQSSNENINRLVIKELNQRERKLFHQTIVNPNAHDTKARKIIALKICLTLDQLKNSIFISQRMTCLWISVCRALKNIFYDRLGSQALIDNLMITANTAPLYRPSPNELSLAKPREPIVVDIRQKDVRNLHKPLGEGVTATVYEHAKNPDWAVKHVHPGRGKHEYYIGAVLHHPYLAKTYKMYIEEDDRSRIGCIVMEKVQGKSILDYRQPIPHELVIKLFIQAKDCCIYLFQEGIAWRDLNPGNIFIDNKQNLKIIDFGQWEDLDDPHLRGKILLWGAMEMMGSVLIAGESYSESNEFIPLDRKEANEYILPKSFFGTEVSYEYQIKSQQDLGYDFYDRNFWMQFIMNQLAVKTDDQIEEFIGHYFDCVIGELSQNQL